MRTNCSRFARFGVILLAAMAFLVVTAAQEALPENTGWAWGVNSYGQLGINSTTNSAIPMEFGWNATAISAGWFHSLAMTTGGAIWAWGNNQYGQLGNGTNVDSHIPILLVPSGGLAVSAGGLHSLALASNGVVAACGSNHYGQLGNNTTTDSNTAVAVLGLTDVTAIAGGGYFSLALKSDGTVWAWGYNASGQLGNGTFTDSHVPVKVSGLSNVVAIAAGGSHGMALKSDSTLWMWGENNYGQLGNNNTTDSNVPVTIGYNVTAISAGVMHSMAITVGGGIWTWGFNGQGQLGNGTTVDKHVPMLILQSGGIAISGGLLNSYYLTSNGTTWATGNNQYGQLGDGTLHDSLVPVVVTGITGVNTLAAGVGFVLAMATCPIVTLSPSTLPAAGVGGSYSQHITASGGTDPYAFVVSAGSLPGGLTLALDGTLAGTPTTAGSYNFTVIGADHIVCMGSQAYAMAVNPPPLVASVGPMASPFRLKVMGGNFGSGIQVFIGGSSSPYANVAYKSSTKLLLQGGGTLKALFPKGTPVLITLVNTDGGKASYTYTR